MTNGNKLTPQAAIAIIEGGLKCPECGSERIQYLEDTTIYRGVERFEAGTLYVEGYYDVDNENSDNPRLMCRDCIHEFPIEGFEIEWA